jgi:hypothetical protein
MKHREFDPAHNVGAMFGLPIERRAHRPYPAGAQIKQLRHDCGRSQVYGDAQAISGRESK